MVAENSAEGKRAPTQDEGKCFTPKRWFHQEPQRGYSSVGEHLTADQIRMPPWILQQCFCPGIQE